MLLVKNFDFVAVLKKWGSFTVGLLLMLSVGSLSVVNFTGGKSFFKGVFVSLSLYSSDKVAIEQLSKKCREVAVFHSGNEICPV